MPNSIRIPSGWMSIPASPPECGVGPWTKPWRGSFHICWLGNGYSAIGPMPPYTRSCRCSGVWMVGIG